MPQATVELQQQFPGSDREALDVLAENFRISRGGVISKVMFDYTPTERELAAIDYLFQEWDYGYE